MKVLESGVTPVVKRVVFDEEGCSTKTSKEQLQVEKKLKGYLSPEIQPYKGLQKLKVNHHTGFIMKWAMFKIPGFAKIFDHMRIVVVGWNLQTLRLLGYHLEKQLCSDMVALIRKLQVPTGGFGGNAGMSAHLSSSYAAVIALINIGTEEAFECINREALLDFLWRNKCGDGTFSCCEGSYSDSRLISDALSLAVILNLYDEELFEGCLEYIKRCETVAGGYSPNPGGEAHGGYTFCCVYSLNLLGKLNSTNCNIQLLLRWLVNCQTSFGGGFSGRPNKLIDSCYSLMLTCTFDILRQAMLNDPLERLCLPKTGDLFNKDGLTEFILSACQNKWIGGIADKPGMFPDPYHSALSLTALSVSLRDFPGYNPLLDVDAAYCGTPLDATQKALLYFQKKGRVARSCKKN